PLPSEPLPPGPSPATPLSAAPAPSLGPSSPPEPFPSLPGTWDRPWVRAAALGAFAFLRGGRCPVPRLARGGPFVEIPGALRRRSSLPRQELLLAGHVLGFLRPRPPAGVIGQDVKVKGRRPQDHVIGRLGDRHPLRRLVAAVPRRRLLAGGLVLLRRVPGWEVFPVVRLLVCSVLSLGFLRPRFPGGVKLRHNFVVALPAHELLDQAIQILDVLAQQFFGIFQELLFVHRRFQAPAA